MILNGIASLSLILLAVYLVIKGIIESRKPREAEADFTQPEPSQHPAN